MSRSPQFKRHLRCAIVPSEGVFLIAESAQVELRGRAFVALAPLLDGRRTEEEIADLLRGSLSAAEVFYALERLRRAGYVVDAAPAAPPGEAAFWDAHDVDPAAASRALSEAAVSVAALGAADAGLLEEALGSLGIGLGDGERLAVTVTDDYLQPELARVNRDRLAAGRPWMLIRPVGLTAWIGPLFHPDRTGCWECLAHRLRSHRKVERYVEARGALPGPVAPALPALISTQRAAFNLAATQIARWLVLGQSDAIEGKVVTLDAASFDRAEHLLTRRPQCPACGDPGLTRARQLAPLSLAPRPKAFTADGGHRALSPRETLRRVERHLSPITGIVGALRSSAPAGAEGMVASYAADHCFVHTNEPLSSLREALQSRAGGKGRHDAQARASALCEAIERYSGIFQGDEARLRASLRSLGGAAIHPNDCMLFSDAQMARRGAADPAGPRQAWIPAPFDDSREIDWSPAWSLTRDERRYLPTALCYFGYAREGEAPFARADSNGCAAGNTLEEAILQGFFELVERDGVAVWWYNRLRRPAVDLDSFGEPYFRELRDHYRSVGRDLWALDLTSDHGIPTIAAVSRRRGGGPEDILLGFGAHFDARLAAMRALTEVNQLLPGARPPADASAPPGSPASFWAAAVVEQHPYLAPDGAAPPRRAPEFSALGGDDLRGDVDTCVRLAAARGLETLVLDQTRADTDVFVVKVVVPGLRHFWPRLAPGRLYDVPVRMGWAADPLDEASLNPHPVYR